MLYPNDCSAMCSRTAKWDFDYRIKYDPSRFGYLTACHVHKSEIHEAAKISALNGEVEISEHAFVRAV